MPPGHSTVYSEKGTNRVHSDCKSQALPLERHFSVMFVERLRESTDTVSYHNPPLG
jgi:hypothetical protein